MPIQVWFNGSPVISRSRYTQEGSRIIDIVCDISKELEFRGELKGGLMKQVEESQVEVVKNVR